MEAQATIGLSGRQGGATMHTRRTLATAVATVILGLSAASNASAGRFEYSSQTFRTVWSAYTMKNDAAGIKVECPLTLEGSFHSRTIAKSAGLLVGFATRVAVGAPCRGGIGRFLEASLPVHRQFIAFAGLLPNIISTMDFYPGLGFLVEIFSISCLYRGTERSPVKMTTAREAGGVLTGVRLDESASIPIIAGQSFLCPSTVQFEGTGSLTVLNSTASIRLTLI